MAVPPKTPVFLGSDYPDAPDWFTDFADILTPFLGDVGTALAGGLDKRNLKRQYLATTLNTSSSLEATFAGGKVSLNPTYGKPNEVRINVSPSTATLYSAGTWVDIKFATGSTWVAFDPTFAQPQYRIDSDGFVSLRGSIKNGTLSGSVAATTFPVGFRPALTQYYTTDTAGAVASEIGILSTGVLVYLVCIKALLRLILF